MAPKGLHIDKDGCRASLHGQWLDLTPVEFRLLSTLASAPGRVWSRRRLLDHLYTDYRIVTDRPVDSHGKNLRRKLPQAGAHNRKSDVESKSVSVRVDLGERQK